VAVQDGSLEREALAISRELRAAGLRCEVYLNPRKGLREQLAYAGKREIPWVVILGPDEMARGKITLKDMARRQQRLVPRAGAAAELASELKGSQVI
jgi:histidyl-tRNA synthetase